MFHRSHLLTRLVAALGLALLSINGAQQCRALCLLANCHAAVDDAKGIAKPSSCSKCCKHVKSIAASSQQAVADGIRSISQDSDQCPDSEPYICCAWPVPAQASSAVDSREVLDSMPIGSNLTPVVPCPNRYSKRLSDVYDSDLARTVSVCVELCRLVI